MYTAEQKLKANTEKGKHEAAQLYKVDISTISCLKTRFVTKTFGDCILKFKFGLSFFSLIADPLE